MELSPSQSLPRSALESSTHRDTRGERPQCRLNSQHIASWRAGSSCLRCMAHVSSHCEACSVAHPTSLLIHESNDLRFHQTSIYDRTTPRSELRAHAAPTGAYTASHFPKPLLIGWSTCLYIDPFFRIDKNCRAGNTKPGSGDWENNILKASNASLLGVFILTTSCWYVLHL